MTARAINYYYKQAEPQNRFTIMHKSAKKIKRCLAMTLPHNININNNNNVIKGRQSVGNKIHIYSYQRFFIIFFSSIIISVIIITFSII